MGVMCVFLFAPLSLSPPQHTIKKLYRKLRYLRKNFSFLHEEWKKKSVERHESFFFSALHAQIDAPRLTGNQSSAGKQPKKKL